MTANEQSSKIKRVNLKYLSLRWKKDSGESQNDNKNILKTRLGCDDKKSNIFSGIKKKLSIKNLCNSKRKQKANVEIVDCPNEDDGSNELNLENNGSNDENSNGRVKPDGGTEEPNESPADNRPEFVNPLEERLDDDADREKVEDVDKTPEVLERPTLGDLQSSKITTKSNLCQELLKLSSCGWYWGNISSDDADNKLLAEPDGAFLIRDSSDDRYLLTLSFKSYGKSFHARIEYSGGMFSLCNQGEHGRFPSVLDLVNYSMNSSKSSIICYSRPRNSAAPSFPVRLIKPVSRFTQVKSLQSLCRFVIRQNTRCDNIHKLPLPNILTEFIGEPYIC